MSHHVYVKSEEYWQLKRDSEELARLRCKVAEDVMRMAMLTSVGHGKAIFVTADGLECLVRNHSKNVGEWQASIERPLLAAFPVQGYACMDNPVPRRTYVRTSERCRGIPVFRERR